MRRFKKLFVTILVVAIVLGTGSAFTGAAGLLDVEGTKYADAVNKLVGINVLTGYPDGTFKPTATVTRAQMAAIMVRGLGHEALAALSKGTTPFADVPATHWASGYINVAYNKGIVSGLGDGKYGPDATVTYAQAVTMLVRAVGRAGEVTGAWPVGYIEVAQKHGLTANVSFDANAPATRGDIAIMTKTAVYNVTDPVTKETLAWSAHKVAAAKPDTTAPVVTLGTLPAKTLAEKVTVTGTLDEAAAVTVNGTAATVVGLTFSAEVALIAGANTITVEATDKYSNKGTATAAITRQTIASIVVTPATAAVALGSSVQFAAKALDEAGAELEGVTFTWSLTGPGILGAAGLYGATGSGAATVKATAGTKEGTATVAAFGTASKIVLSTPGTIVANAKSKTTLTATVQDAAGNTIGNFAGTISFASAAPGSVKVSSGSVAAVGGVAQVTLTSGSVGGIGPAVISVSGTGLTGSSVTVTPTAQKLTSVVLSADPTSVAADNTSQVTITAAPKDQEGVAMAAPSGLAVKVTASPTDALSFGGATPDTADITTWTPGTVILTAKNTIGTATVNGVVTAPPSLTSVPVTATSASTKIVGAPYKLSVDPITDVAAGTSQSVTVRVLDVNGSQITNSTTVTVTVKVGGGTVGSGTTTNGKFTCPYTTTTAGTVTYDATATWGSPSLTLVAASGTGNFTVGTATQITLVAAPLALNANGTHTAVLTATVKDANGNKVTAGSYPIKFTKTAASPASTQTFAETVVNTTDGIATVTVTARTNQSVPGDLFTATSTGLIDGTTNVPAFIMGAPNRVAIPTAPANKVVGNNMTVVAAVQDANPITPITVTSDNGRAVTLTVTDSAGTVVGTYSASTVNGLASFTVNLTKTDTYTFSASASGLTTTTTQTAQFTEGALASLVLTSDLTAMANGGSVAALSIGGKDAYGNTKASWSSTTITVATDTTAYGTLGGTTSFEGNTGPVSATTFTSNANAGPTVITASATGVTSSSITITTQVVGVAAKLRVEPITDKTANGTASQSVKVTVLDAAGNRVTSDMLTSVALGKNTGSTAIIAGSPATASKGQATFTVTDVKAETNTYTATATGLTLATGSGTFVAGPIAALSVGNPSPMFIKGNGSQIATYAISVVDATGNLVSAANGTVTFTITVGNDYATVLTPTVTITNGVGTAMVQAKTTTSQNLVTVKASTTDIKKPDGVAATLGTNALLVVDSVAPTVTLTFPTPHSTTPTLARTYTAGPGDDSGENTAATIFYYRQPPQVTWSTFTNGTTTLVNGTLYNFKVATSDLAGNAAESAVVTVTLDTTAPTATLPATTGGTNNATTIVATFSEGLYLNGVAVANAANVASSFTAAGGTLAITTAIYDSTAKTITFTLTGAADTNTITHSGTGVLQLTDVGGNAYAAKVYTYTAGTTLWASN